MITVTDLFCGAGGSGLGAHAVPGVELRIAANHWRLAVDTHAHNFPTVDHDCADISQANPRRYPRTDILWASPECTNHSQAKGRRRPDTQPDLFGDALPDEAAERSRATMWDVPRFAEHHRYSAVIVENVVDAARWVMWPAWLQAMTLLGYRHRVVFLNSMHAPAIAAPRAPQSRDRLYVVFWHGGNQAPDLDIRPAAWCPTCQREVAAVQSWKKPGEPWGRYRAQYLYRCPRMECRHSIIEPYADPAATAIDWTLPGQRIGDRAKPLSPKTLARIQAGLERYARPMTFEARGNTFVRTDPDGTPRYCRAWPVDQPTATLTTSETRALVTPFITNHRGGPGDYRTSPVNAHLPTVTASGNHLGLVVPVEAREGVRARSARQALRTQTARLQDALVVPYYGTGVAHPTDRPLPTVTTVDGAGVAFIAELRGGHSDARHVREPLATVTASGNHHMLVRHNTARGNPAQMCTPTTEPARTITTAGHQSLVGWADTTPAVEDCTFRMLEPREIGRAMAFHHTYRVLGNRREQVRQLGNAVTPPAAEWLITAVVDALERPNGTHDPDRSTR
ncbi:MAG TPA: DNA cytosine methyltransferase [Pseudonocardiaceae bacterium]|nr:DNA cytosine methyltransferase [Pseudonocardiaceae bacterium]